MANNDLISTAEAAAILGTTVSTVNRRAIAGQIPVAQQLPGMTGARLFRRSVVTRLAERLAVEKRAELATLTGEAS